MKNKRLSVVLMVLGIVAVTGFPYFKDGLCVYFPDLMYHLLRTEGVKSALLAGEFPVRIYTNFFNGYGYGSPLFYPDIFLLFPALLRIFEVPPIVTWKIFAIIITIAATLSTYFSIKYISKSAEWSIAGTFMIMLSQFYLADLHLRGGISEYIAFIFIPILVAGIYDFFIYDGKRTYLMGIAFAGLLLSHSIMTFIGVLITVVIFLKMAFVKRESNYLFDSVRMKRLLVTAVCTVLVVAYYLFPMLEQMNALELRYSEPWAYIGRNTQPFSSFFRIIGTFSVIAYIGIGVPIFPLMIISIFVKDSEKRWGKAFLYGGIGLFLITTNIVPWRLLENTILNMIQFTYRFWPYAIVFVVIGIVMLLSEKTKNIPLKYKQLLVLSIVGVSMLAGAFQNRMTAWTTSEETREITDEYLIEANNYVGAGEWLPIAINEDVLDLSAPKEIINDENTCIFPLIYYKGYEAWSLSEEGDKIKYPVTQNGQGLVTVEDIGNVIGEISVEYTGTMIQKVSTVFSAITLIGISLCWYKNRFVKKR